MHLKKHMHLLEEIGTDRLQYQDRLTMEICFEMRGQKLGQPNNNQKRTMTHSVSIRQFLLLTSTKTSYFRLFFAVHDIVTNFPA